MYVYHFNSCLDLMILILDLFSRVIKKENIVVPFVFRLSLSIHLNVVHGTMHATKYFVMASSSMVVPKSLPQELGGSQICITCLLFDSYKTTFYQIQSC